MIIKNLLLCSITSFNSATLMMLNHNEKIVERATKTHIKDSGKILDFKKIMQDALKWETEINSYYTGMVVDSYQNFDFVNEKGKKKDVTVSNMLATPIGKPNVVYEDKNFNFMGHSILKNESEIAQTGSTPIYEKDISSTVSASTTLGVSVDASFSSTKTTSQTITKKYIIPAQNIVIPPRTQIEVNEYWSQVKMTQNVSLTMDISGWARGVFYVHFPSGRKQMWTEIKPLGQIIYAYQEFYWPDCPKQLAVDTKNSDIIHFSGIMECWDAGAGSSFNLDVGPPEPITF